MSDAWVRPCLGQVTNLLCTAGCVKAIKHHESAVGISCHPSHPKAVNPASVTLMPIRFPFGEQCWSEWRSWSVSPYHWVTAVAVLWLVVVNNPSRSTWRCTGWKCQLFNCLLVWCRWWAVRHRTTGLFSCFLVEGSRLSSPLTGRVEILNHQKKLTGLSIPSITNNQSHYCH